MVLSSPSGHEHLSQVAGETDFLGSSKLRDPCSPWLEAESGVQVAARLWAQVVELSETEMPSCSFLILEPSLGEGSGLTEETRI